MKSLRRSVKTGLVEDARCSSTNLLLSDAKAYTWALQKLPFVDQFAILRVGTARLTFTFSYNPQKRKLVNK